MGNRLTLALKILAQFTPKQGYLNYYGTIGQLLLGRLFYFNFSK